ncbi:MAG: putative metal-binding motif-containing protein [Myxococcota bacterium]|nr:putative metal-binding motif-containing protein [Myxococcota bacterium]
MNIIRISLLLSVFSCGKDDTDAPSDPDLGDPCEAEFTVQMPDGTAVEMDECKHHGVEVEFATMPDISLPQPHNISFVFRSTKDTAVDCWVRWDVSRSCPDRTQYDLGGDDNTLTWNTNGCDVPEEARGEFEATYGSSEFTTMTTTPRSGLEEASPMAINFSATIQAAAEDGTELIGTIVVDRDVPLTYTAFAGCSGSEGDADQDGSIGTQYGGDDCDDNDPTIGPHAIEVCDEVDNNCDGAVDEGVTTTYYRDDDGDDYGQDEATTEACEPPAGFAAYAGDCDDSAAQINPAETEVCDGIDNDCDEVADEGTEIAIYIDEDGDGFGADPPIATACPDDVPAGYSPEGMDCDDDNDAAHPGALETCDGADNDCNGETDELPECD